MRPEMKQLIITLIVVGLISAGIGFSIGFTIKEDFGVSERWDYIFLVNGTVYRTNFSNPPEPIVEIRSRTPDGREVNNFAHTRAGYLFYLGAGADRTIHRLNLLNGKDDSITSPTASLALQDIVASDDGQFIAYEERNDCGSPDNPPFCIARMVLFDTKTGEKILIKEDRFARGTVPGLFHKLVQFCPTNEVALIASPSFYRKFPERRPIMTSSLLFFNIGERRLSEPITVTNYNTASTADLDEAFWDRGRLSPDCSRYITYVQDDPVQRERPAIHRVVERGSGRSKDLYSLPPTNIPPYTNFRFSGNGSVLFAKLVIGERPRDGAPSYNFDVVLIDSRSPGRVTRYSLADLRLRDGSLTYTPAFPRSLNGLTLSPDGSRLIYPVQELDLRLPAIAVFNRNTENNRFLFKDNIPVILKEREKKCVQAGKTGDTSCDAASRSAFLEAYRKEVGFIETVGWQQSTQTAQ